jgi:cell wall-associated NlpC family hydrolase
MSVAPKDESAPSRRVVAVAAMPLRARPDDAAEQVSQGLFGEEAEILADAGDGFVSLRLSVDGYEGFARARHLAEPVGPATHIVSVPATFLFPAADIKSAPARPLYAASRLLVIDRQGAFLRVALPGGGSGWVFAAHVRAMDAPSDDAAAFAERLLHAPYLWGGRSVAGIDCSGLVQIALMLAGHHDVPRDSGPQSRTIGTPLPLDMIERGGLRRGDLVFWKGHVGMMLDETRLVHANAHHMAVAVEPLSQAMARTAAAGSPVTAFRRLFPQ